MRNISGLEKGNWSPLVLNGPFKHHSMVWSSTTCMEAQKADWCWSNTLLFRVTVDIRLKSSGPNVTVRNIEDEKCRNSQSLIFLHHFAHSTAVPFPQEEETSWCFASTYYCTYPSLWCFLHTAHSKINKCVLYCSNCYCNCFLQEYGVLDVRKAVVLMHLSKTWIELQLWPGGL